jgi:PAS domain S-box-containing protein
VTLLARLFLLVVIAILPAIAIQAYNEFDLRESRKAEAGEQALRLTRLASADLGRIGEGARQLILAFAQNDMIRQRSWEQCSRFAAGLLGTLDGYVDIGVATPEGKVVCSGLPDPAPAFAAALADLAPARTDPEDLLLGKYSVVPGSGARFVPYAYRHRDNRGMTDAIVFAMLNLDWLKNTFATRFHASDDVTLLITDRDGTILLRLPDPEHWVGKAMGVSYLPMLDASGEGVAQIAGIDGDPRIIAYSPLKVPPHNLYIAVALSKTSTLAPIDRSTERGVVLILAGLVLALIAAVVGGSLFIRRPIAILVDAAQKWQEGHVGVRANLSDKYSEIGRLGRAFDEMAGRIEERERELERAKERAVRREKSFSDALINSSLEGIAAWDRDFTITIWNRAIAQFTAVPSETAIGRNFFELFPSVAGSETETAMRAALSGRQSHLTPLRYPPETEQIGFFEAQHASLRDESGTIVGGLLFLRDITARLQTEEALRQAQKMEAVGQLTGGIAHDFNNLLTIIIGNLEILQNRIGKGNPQAKFVESATGGAMRAAALTQRLLAYSRRQPLDPKTVDLNKLVSGISDLLRRTLGESIAVEIVPAAGLWRCHVDPNQLETALLNLVINARDAMLEGGRLTIETANILIDEAYSANHREVTPGQYVMLAVSDTGEGMAPEIVGKAFEPFFTTKDVGKGSGLGLSMVYGFVKQSRGHVKIYSEIGAGTTVKIYLPRRHGADPVEPRSFETAPGETGEETILVVEDDPGVRDYTVDALKLLGYRIIETADAEEALRAVESAAKLDLLFTDIGLPGRDGRTLAAEVRRRRPGLKVLYTTGYARNAIVHNGILDPGLHLIAKPFTLDLLARKIRAVLGSAE